MYETLSEIKPLMLWACDKVRYPYDRYKIGIKFNSRFKTTLGRAKWNNLSMNGIIEFSSKLWPIATVEQRRENVIHEACHIFAFFLAALDKRKIEPHGKEWQEMMRICGYINPSPYHDIKLEHPDWVKAACKCKQWCLNPIRAKRIKARTMRYTCKDCSTSLKLI